MAGSLIDLAKYRFECCYFSSKKDAEEQLQRAELFKGYVEEYLKNKNLL